MFSILRVQHFLKVRTCSLLFLSRSSCICWISRSDLLFRAISALLFFDGFFVILRLLVLKKLSRINFLKTKKVIFVIKIRKSFWRNVLKIFFSRNCSFFQFFLLGELWLSKINRDTILTRFSSFLHQAGIRANLAHFQTS